MGAGPHRFPPPSSASSTTDTAMDSSTSPETTPRPVPRESRVDTAAAQSAAMDGLIGLAEQKLQVFDIDLSQAGWDTAVRAANLAAFLRRTQEAQLQLIVHDTRWLEGSCPRLLNLLKLYSTAITDYRTGSETRIAMDPLGNLPGTHSLHSS